MKIKKIGLLLLLSLLLNSCNLHEKLERLQRITDDLEQHFEHDNVNLVIGFGTEAEDNNAKVFFYEYDVSSNNYQTLKKLSKKVSERLNAKYPEFRKKQYIEIRFTEESKSDENNSFVNFRHYN